MPTDLPGHPLCSWRLHGFRSIRDATTFDLGGLNVLVGANSAGKSSVLHSVLMTAQTLGNPLADRPLVLNGSLVRLGLADDIVHEGSKGHIGMGFSLRPIPGAVTGGAWHGSFDLVDVDTSLRIASGGQDFEVVDTTVRARQSEPVDDASTLRIERRGQAVAEKVYRSAGLLRDDARRITAGRNEFGVHGSVPKTAAGARARQFLPDHLLVVANQYEHELWWTPIHGSYGSRFARTSVAVTPKTPMSRAVRSFVRTFLQEHLGEDAAASVSDADSETAGRFWNGLSGEARDALQTPAFHTFVDERRTELPFRGVAVRQELPPSVDGSLDFSRRWFQTRVSHLGPLRAEPQPLHGLPEAASGTSVGRSGEYTAAVLSAHRDRRVVSPDPAGTGSRQLHLEHAVNEWMAAMNLLSSVHAEERGKLGYQLHLSVDGVRRDLDLTTVGVGVSQALPVVVLGLISPPGSLLLFEQPELHLHPDVQASLGDFFLALARSGRQLIVETHSEYLVNRLRRRAATDPDHSSEDLTRLFFFERSGDTSDVRAVRIGPGGSMPGWPRGFLDTAAREIEAIAAGFRR